MKIIVWGNYKGGVGKTTSVFQVANYFAKQGKKLLLIDLDPQCSLSNICSNTIHKYLDKYLFNQTFNYIIEIYSRYISYNHIDIELLLNNSISIKDKMKNIIKSVTHSVSDNLFFIPSSISFENCRLNDLSSRMESNIFNIFLISLFIQNIDQNEYDYIFIDTPPTSNILLHSSFLAADYYIVPTIIDEISAKGVPDYISEIEKTYNKYSMHKQIGSILLKKICNDKIRLLGVFETIYKERRGNSDNSNQIIMLDDNINKVIKDVIISNNNFKQYRYNKKNNNFETKNIFCAYIAHKDNRSGKESISLNTSKGNITPSYEDLSLQILNVLENI